MVVMDNCCHCGSTEKCPPNVAREGLEVGLNTCIRPILEAGTQKFIYWGQDLPAGPYKARYCGGIQGIDQGYNSFIWWITRVAFGPWDPAVSKPVGIPPDECPTGNCVVSYFQILYQSGGVQVKGYFDDPVPPDYYYPCPPFCPPFTVTGYGYAAWTCGDGTGQGAIDVAKGVANNIPDLYFTHEGGPIGVRMYYPQYTPGAGQPALAPDDPGPTFALFQL